MSNVTKFTPLMQPARPYLEPMQVPIEDVQAHCRDAVAARRAADAGLSTEQERDARLLGALSYALPALYLAFCQHAQHRDYCGIFDAGRLRCSCPLSTTHALVRGVLHELADRGDLLSQQWAREALNAPGSER